MPFWILASGGICVFGNPVTGSSTSNVAKFG